MKTVTKLLLSGGDYRGGCLSAEEPWHVVGAVIWMGPQGSDKDEDDSWGGAEEDGVGG